MNTKTFSLNSDQNTPLIRKPAIMLAIGALLNLAFSLWLLLEYGDKHALIWWVATLLGFTFLRSGYGFTRAWRSLVTAESTVGVRSHLLWIAVGTCLMFPVFQLGWFDTPVFDITRPVGLMMLSGAFIFGIGMQLSGSCTSGSMYLAGSGQIRMFLAIIGIVVGAFYAALQYGFWAELPTYFVYSYQRNFSWPIAILIQLIILGLLWQILSKLEIRWNGNLLGIFNNTSVSAMPTSQKDAPSARQINWQQIVFGQWSLGVGSIILAILSFLSLILLTRPWVISLAFPFWGAKVAPIIGADFDFEFWDYWGISVNESMLQLGLFEDVTSLMNIAFILGATWAHISLIKTSVQKLSAVNKNIPKKIYLSGLTLIGGFLMGYGAVIGLGCNIGGFIAAVLSGSVHGWAWVFTALLGTLVGVQLRKLLRIGA
jgi:uncharacterized membrane protein YedE/YeeE